MRPEKLLLSLALAALMVAAAGCTTTARPIDVGIVIMDHQRQAMWQGNLTVEGLTPLAALQQAAQAGGFDYELNVQGNYVTRIMNLSENSGQAGWQGWMFFVNGTMPLSAVTDVHLSSGSTLVWYYGAFGETPFD